MLCSVSFSQILVFPGRLCSKACQHILDIVGLSQAEVWRTYLNLFNSHWYSFMKTNPTIIKAFQNTLRFCWQQLFGPLRSITVSLKSIRPDKTEINIIAENMFAKCQHPGSNLQLAPPCDHCSNALPTELPPLLRKYWWNFVNYRKQIKHCGNSIEIVPFWSLMMWCSFKSQHEINFTSAHLNR